jgi:uncharacterized protein (TIGR02996 family)
MNATLSAISPSADQAALIGEIAAHPDDDMPRLIYADWLEEQGYPQGEFIRLQCESARATDPLLRRELIERETELLRRHRLDWLKPFGNELIRGVFHRGVLDQAEVKPDAFLEEADDWLRRFPLTILQLNLCDVPLRRLADIPRLRQIRSLRVSGSSLRDNGCIRLLQAKNIGPLEELWLSSNLLTHEAVRWLACSQLANSLQVLILSGNQLGAEGQEILAAGPIFLNLRRLYISSCGIAPQAAEQIQQRHPRLEGVSCS